VLSWVSGFGIVGVVGEVSDCWYWVYFVFSVGMDDFCDVVDGVVEVCECYF